MITVSKKALGFETESFSDLRRPWGKEGFREGEACPSLKANDYREQKRTLGINQAFFARARRYHILLNAIEPSGH
jgi:hypothetical protein